MDNKKRDKIQSQALKAWLNSDKQGTQEIVTGVGKTFIALMALYTMPKNNDIHLFLAETNARKEDLIKNIDKFNEKFNVDVLSDYNLQFYCYQSVYKWKKRKFGLVIADEIHDSLTPTYSKFYQNNEYKAIIGLSATVNRSISYEINDKIITKGYLLDIIAPVCFRYTLDQAKEDKTSRELDIYVIAHHLDNKDKYIKAGSKKKPFYTTEQSAYEYWDKRHKRSWYIEEEEDRLKEIKITAYKRNEILYGLKSKVDCTKKLLDALKSKTILFGNDIDVLLLITPNVVSSRNSDKENEYIRYNFERNKIDVIASFKKLKQGANLTGLDNCVIISYYSTDVDLIQRIGRLRNNGEIGRVFIFLTIGTQEEVWFSKMFDDINTVNMIYCEDVEDCINKIE